LASVVSIDGTRPSPKAADLRWQTAQQLQGHAHRFNAPGRVPIAVASETVRRWWGIELAGFTDAHGSCSITAKNHHPAAEPVAPPAWGQRACAAAQSERR
jgi:hypothetical protein